MRISEHHGTPQMNSDEFRKQGYKLIDRIADYYLNVRDYPVQSQVLPGEIFNQIPDSAPDSPEEFDKLMEDYEKIILPGITHWQSPNFFAYFPANTSFPSVLAELLTSSIGAQCMVWLTSPAASELEEKVMNWLRDMVDLPNHFHGVIQDTASTATLVSLLTAREKATDYSINKSGFENYKFKVYCSSEAHSSIEKAVKIAGIGKENLVKIPVNEDYSMRTDLLEEAIISDIQNGFKPLFCVAALGTTGTTSVDSIKSIGDICSKYKIWLHVDAAFAGSAMILPEYRHHLDGIENCDTFVFNPHKWLFTNFDCSAYYVKDKEALIRTFEIMPEYLKTNFDDHVNNYRDWGIQLGRRFRALKLWFVIRSFGVTGLQQKLREHLRLANIIKEKIIESKNFELLAPVPFNVICFRYVPAGIVDLEIINKLNQNILDSINKSGKAFFTHTKLNGKFTIRFVIAQTEVTENDVLRAWELIQEQVKLL